MKIEDEIALVLLLIFIGIFLYKLGYTRGYIKAMKYCTEALDDQK